MLSNKSLRTWLRDGGILTDILIIFAIGITLSGGVLYSLRFNQASESNPEEPDRAKLLRKMFMQMQDEISRSTHLQIGEHHGGDFTIASEGSLQTGSAIRIFLVTNEYEFVEYRLRTFENRPYLQRIEGINERMLRSEMICTYAQSDTPPFALKVKDGETVLRNSDSELIELKICFRPPAQSDSPSADSICHATIPYEREPRIL